MSFPPRLADSERTVLIVDDDEELRANLASCLTTAGFTVAQATDGIDALSYLYATRPCAVLIDLMMPRMDGVELIEQIRSDPNLAGVGIVAVSGMPGMLARARKAGADEALCKPLDPLAILRALLPRRPS
jgi:CheY-like chemotaxis protein